MSSIHHLKVELLRAGKLVAWLSNDDVQEFDARWDEILLSMTKSPPDDILESQYKLRIRELINSTPYGELTTWKFLRRFRRSITKGSEQW